jgi:hypothetical protein
MSNNQNFLNHASKLISEDPDHPLRFLLNLEGRVATMANRTFSMYSADDWRAGKPHLSIERPSNDRTSSEDIALADSRVVVSCDACHVTSKTPEHPEHFALGISGEDNRSHGLVERKLKQSGFVLEHDAVLINAVPVIRDSALKWEKAGLLPEGTVALSPPSAGWNDIRPRIPSPIEFCEITREEQSRQDGEAPKLPLMRNTHGR